MRPSERAALCRPHLVGGAVQRERVCRQALEADAADAAGGALEADIHDLGRQAQALRGGGVGKAGFVGGVLG